MYHTPPAPYTPAPPQGYTPAAYGAPVFASDINTLETSRNTAIDPALDSHLQQNTGEQQILEQARRGELPPSTLMNAPVLKLGSLAANMNHSKTNKDRRSALHKWHFATTARTPIHIVRRNDSRSPANLLYRLCSRHGQVPRNKMVYRKGCQSLDGQLGTL